MGKGQETKEQQLAAAIQNQGSSQFNRSLARWLNSVVPWDNIILLAFFQDRGPEVLFSESPTPEVHQHMADSYIKGVYLLDPYHDLHLRMARNGVYRLNDIAPDHFNRSRYYVEYYEQTTIIDEFAFMCRPAPGVTLQLCLGRDKASARKFSQIDLLSATQCEPVVEALLARQWSKLGTKGAFVEAEAIDQIVESAHSRHQIKLTQRQAEIAFLILKGHSSVSIGMRLGISYQTVKVFRRQIYERCNVSTQAELFSLFVPLLKA